MSENSKKYLLTRFGGIGDASPIIVVAEQLKKLGHTVHIALRTDDHGTKQVDLLKGLDCCDVAMELKEIGPWGTRCVSYPHGWVDVSSLYTMYDKVIDFMNIVENNTTCKTTMKGIPGTEWESSVNSNWVNWYDLHLAWANIDPTSVPESEKRPTYKLSKDELKVVKSIKKDYSDIFVINPFASSLSRTWYQAEDLIPRILKDYVDPTIFFWNPSLNVWDVHTKTKSFKYTSDIKSPIRASMCVVGAADVYIGADTGFTHIAEGLGIDNIAIYSSVPAWTRAKYYEYQTPIDKGYYTFALTLGDPLRIIQGMESLGEREQKILELHESGAPIEVASKELNTTKDGVNLELKALKTKIESFERIQSKSLSEVTVDEVMDTIEQVLKYEAE